MYTYILPIVSELLVLAARSIRVLVAQGTSGKLCCTLTFANFSKLNEAVLVQTGLAPESLHIKVALESLSKN